MNRLITIPFTLAILVMAGCLFDCCKSKIQNVAERKLSFKERKKARSDHFFEMLKDPRSGKIPENVRNREISFARSLRASSARSAQSEVFPHNWEELGPENIGGRSRALCIDQRDDNVIIAGGVSGGIWKTTDRGLTWTPRLDEGSNLTITSITQDPGNPDTWYASMGEGFGTLSSNESWSFYWGSGIYKSTDNGDTWDLITYELNQAEDVITATTTDVSQIYNSRSNPTLATSKILAYHFEGTTYIFLCSLGNGLWISQDGGNSFDRYQADLTAGEDPYFSEIIIDGDGIITVWFGPTASSDGGFFRSYIDADENIGFDPVNPSEYSTPVERARAVLAFAPSNPKIVYAFSYLASDATTFVGFDFTEYDVDGTWDGVSSYENRSDNLPTFGGGVDTQSGYDMAIAVHPTDPDIVVLGYVDAIKSNDAFATALEDEIRFWIGGSENEARIEADYPPFDGVQHADQHLFCFDSEGRFYAGHDGGLSYTDNLTEEIVEWSSLNNSYNVTQYYDVSFSRDSDVSVVIGGTQDNGTPLLEIESFAIGDPLVPSIADLSTGDGSFCYVGKTFVYASAQHAGIKVHPFEGFDPETVPSVPFLGLPVPDDADNFPFIAPFTVDPNDEGTIFLPHLDEGYILRNTMIDEAVEAQDASIQEEAWEQMDLPAAASVTALKVSDKAPSHRLYFGGQVLETDEPYFAVIEDANVIDASAPDVIVRDLSGLGIPNGSYLSDIAINPYDADEIVIVYSNYNITGLFHSLDAGATFTAIEGNLDSYKGGTDDSDEFTGPSLRAAEIITDESDETQKFVIGTSVGVYSTETLNGNNTQWKLEVLENVIVEDLDSRPDDNAILVGTHGRGLFIGIPESTNSQPVFSNQSFDVDENSSEGTLVGTLEASDPDNDELSFTILSGNDGQFSLDGSSGNLTVADAEAFDFEATASYTLVVEVSDGNGATAQANVTVSVNDVNEPPEFEAIDFTVDENVANGTSVGIITAVDPEDDDITFALAQTDDVFDVSSDGEITVIDGSLIDFETNTSFTFDVLASDGELTTEALILVEVNDLDDQALSVQNQGMTIYPNPTADMIFLDGLDASVNYRLSNLSGQVIDTGFLEDRSKASIDLSTLEPGIYLITMMTKSFQETIRVTKK